MTARKKTSAIGLSMLDLISNSLAAVIILFIILSSLRIPFIPPERIKGTLFVRYELIPKHKQGIAESEIWVEPPHHPDLKQKRYYQREILKMNEDKGVFLLFSDCNKLGEQFRFSKEFVTPCVMNYSPLDSPNVHYLVIRDPVKGFWKTGVFYKEHSLLTSNKQPSLAIFKAWFVASEEPSKVVQYEKPLLTATTDSLGIRIQTPNWETGLF